jgi:integrase/recombinase XerD
LAQLPRILISSDTYNRKQVVSIRFPFDQKIINRIKTTTPALWSGKNRFWYIEEPGFDLKKFLGDFAGYDINTENYKPYLLPQKATIPEEYISILKRKRYSENTVKTYLNYFKDFAGYFAGRNLNEISAEEINGYILELIEKKHISSSQQNQRINAIHPVGF